MSDKNIELKYEAVGKAIGEIWSNRMNEINVR
jgi:hypothetical protein